MKILITGATGFVGSKLTLKLLSQGHEINILTRQESKVEASLKHTNLKIFEWNPETERPPTESLIGINGVINLMGENIAGKRWSLEQKEKLRSSRINATLKLVEQLNQSSSSLDFFISSSAVGIYPVNTDEVFDENSKLGTNFLAKLCIDWESAAMTFHKTKRTIIIRTGVVLEKHGGALQKMLPPFQLGLGGPIGDGNHFMSWIHLDDLVNIFSEAVNNSAVSGVINGVAPHPVNNFDFTKELGHALHRPTLFPVPEFMLKLMFGEMSSVILDSQKIVSKRLVEIGFKFQYPDVKQALEKIFL